MRCLSLGLEIHTPNRPQIDPKLASLDPFRPSQDATHFGHPGLPLAFGLSLAVALTSAPRGKLACSTGRPCGRGPAEP